MAKPFIAFDNDGSKTPNRKLRRGKLSFKNDSSFTAASRTTYTQVPNSDSSVILTTDSNTYKGKSTTVATPVFINAGSSTTSIRDTINKYRNGLGLANYANYYQAIDWWVTSHNGLIYYKDRVFPTPLMNGNCRAVFDPAFESLGLIDARGYSANYSKINGPTINTTGGITSWQFNGSTQAIRLGGISAFNPDANSPAATTLNMWFKANNVSSQQAVLSDNWGPEWGIWIGSNAVVAYAYGGTSKSIVANRWYMATLVTIDNYPSATQTTRKLYVDGVYIGQGINNIGNGMNDTPFTLGFDYKGGSPANYFNGFIGHTSFWNDEMTAAEILTLYESTKHSYGF